MKEILDWKLISPFHGNQAAETEQKYLDGDDLIDAQLATLEQMHGKKPVRILKAKPSESEGSKP